MNKPTRFPLTVDSLVSANGNYIISYTYCNWGDNVLFMLPNFMIANNEWEINTAVINAPDDTFEMSSLMYQFIQEFPDTPFIVTGNCMLECVKIMNERLSKYKTFEEFAEHSAEFDKWRTAIYRVSEDYDIIYKACDEGWRSVI